ncbi:MAG: GH3 auxin-responsive promoter family protein, partial [bacterium]
IIDNAEKALVVACSKTGAVIHEYTAAPLHKDSDMTHQWLIEFEKPPADMEFFREAFDNALKSLNSDYEAKRYQNLILKSPVVISVPGGTFYKWMKKRDKLGGQNKVPRLSNDREYVDDILEML